MQDADLSSLSFATESPQIGSDFESAAASWVETSENTQFLIIDTYSKVKPPKTGATDDNEREYKILSQLKAMTDQHGLATVLVHHQNKSFTEDPYDSVLGSTAITGAVDSIILLHGTPSGTVLMGKGRDIESFEYAVDFEDFRWKILGRPNEVYIAATRQKILDGIGDEVVGPKELAETLGLDHENVRKNCREW
ncbi:AAA family ATPase [Paracoccus sp. SCSIO 75233]|nr:AAA family ATPase [Paracoccus sp. SCSIO 75233]WBU54005.1 AAA family ATPase [Paracoccus sp. SCSIO 75233]